MDVPPPGGPTPEKNSPAPTVRVGLSTAVYVFPAASPATNVTVILDKESAGTDDTAYYLRYFFNAFWAKLLSKVFARSILAACTLGSNEFNTLNTFFAPSIENRPSGE